MNNYQVINSNGKLVCDLLINEPIRTVDICTIISTWQGIARNKNEAIAKAKDSWNKRNF
jgi:hypothetical protein